LFYFIPQRRRAEFAAFSPKNPIHPQKQKARKENQIYSTPYLESGAPDFVYEPLNQKAPAIRPHLLAGRLRVQSELKSKVCQGENAVFFVKYIIAF
jgi:hypothetical protein